MTDTVRSLAQQVAEGSLSAEEAAPRIHALMHWVSKEEYNSPEARQERFNDDLPVAEGNSFATVTALWMMRKLTDEQYAILKSGTKLTYIEDE